MKIGKQPLLLFLFLCLVSIFLSGCKGKKDTVVLRMGHALDAQHPVHEAMLWMAQEIALQSEGKMEIRIYPNQQLGSERELVELLQIGSLDMTKVSTAILESFCPEYEIFSLPYLFESDEHRWQVLQGPIGQSLLDAPERVWLKGLCYFDAGKRSFYSKNQPIQTTKDLKGLKIRVMESPTAMRMIRAFGGSATPVSWAELYTALQQGVVDAAENNPPSLLSSRHYEICPYYSLNEHTAMPDVVVVAQKTWEKLGEEEKDLLSTVAQKAATYQFALWERAEKEAMQELESKGVQISRPNREEFSRHLEDFYQDLAERKPDLFKLREEIKALHHGQ